jgi:predicted nuclease of predicted toxin-antitoxin system
MRIKLDENLPVGLARRLKDLGHDVQTVHDGQLVGREDGDIWKAAPRESRLLLTEDLDFADLRRFVPGSHFGILLIRLRSPSRVDLIDRVAQMFREQDVEGWARCFVIVTERKIRVLKP